MSLFNLALTNSFHASSKLSMLINIVIDTYLSLTYVDHKHTNVRNIAAQSFVKISKANFMQMSCRLIQWVNKGTFTKILINTEIQLCLWFYEFG